MPTIEKRISQDGTVSYRATVRLKGQPRESSTWEKKTDALAWARKTEEDMRQRRHFGASKRHTLVELLDRYEAARLPKLKSGDSVKPRLDFWRKRQGKTMLFNLTPDVIADERDKLLATPKQRGGGKRSAADVNRFLAVLSSACSYGVKELRWLERNPLEHVSKGKESKGRVRFLSDEELKRFLPACHASSNPNLYLAVLLSLTTGGRKSEIMSLRWRQINLQARTATLFDTKNGESRVLPISGEAYSLLEARNKVRNLKDDRLFPPKAGSEMPYADVRHSFEDALEQAGIGHYEGEGKRRRFVHNFHWHDLRHTFASYHTMAGTSPLEISKVLGHRTMAMVARYSHLSAGRVVELGDMIANRLGVGS